MSFALHFAMIIFDVDESPAWRVRRANRQPLISTTDLRRVVTLPNPACHLLEFLMPRRKLILLALLHMMGSRGYAVAAIIAIGLEDFNIQSPQIAADALLLRLFGAFDETALMDKRLAAMPPL